jgi:predicted phage terminase large subunit-like protein
MRHLEHERDIYDHHSKQYALIVFEELTEFTEKMFWYLLSRNRTMCGISPYLRATCNPNADSFVAKLIEWWIDQETGYAIPERSGVVRWILRIGDDHIACADSRDELIARHKNLIEDDARPMSFTFISGSLDDNQALLDADPGYGSRLSLLNKVDRERLKKGNWKIRPSAGMYFRRSYFHVVDSVPGRLVRVTRGWDKAATEPSQANKDPDYTAGVKMGKLDDGRYIVLHVERGQLSPGKVDRMMKNTAELDGKDVRIKVFQDPGQAGVVDVSHMRCLLDGYNVGVTRPTKDKVTYAGPYSSAAEGGRVLILKGPWNDAYISEHEAFPTRSVHDDQVDASSAAYDDLQVHELATA